MNLSSFLFFFLHLSLDMTPTKHYYQYQQAGIAGSCPLGGRVPSLCKLPIYSRHYSDKITFCAFCLLFRALFP